MPEHPICLLGAAGDTSNLGVNALLESTLIGLADTIDGASMTVFDNGLGARSGVLDGPDGPVEYERLGIRASRRIQRSESLINMAICAKLGKLPNRGVQRLRAADAVLDISGGDSFSDIYGPERFRAITQQKAVALSAGAPLVLLPQTYGPFAAQKNLRRASELVRRASLAWARDAQSFDVLRELLGDDFDEDRHRVAVDVAFGLPSRRPRHLASEVAAWLDGDEPVFGVNISGLLANDDDSHHQFGLRSHHASLVRRVLELLLDETDARILLVPHVRSDLWVVESDIAACRRFAEELSSRDPDRVRALEDIDQAQEVKWVIGQCDAFCGTRMHSVIAAVSSCTPAIAFAYSPKTQGVLESCGQGERVVDLRQADADDVEARVLELWADRHTVRRDLSRAMPSVIARSRAPFSAIGEMVTHRADHADTRGGRREPTP